MANPRQRRKLRSGTHKPVHHSRQAKKLLKKQPVIRGPKVLQDAWDKHRTVRQNYENMGLLTSLNPTASGGVEGSLVTFDRHRHPIESSDIPEDSSLHAEVPVAGISVLPKGYGRIVRDANGNIMNIELGEEDAEGTEELPGKLFEDIPNPSTLDTKLARWVSLPEIDPRKPNTTVIDVVHCLEEMSKTNGAQTPRFTSSGEHKVLRQLVAKYNEDMEAMARDRKLNPDQRTAGELRRAMNKAGGVAELRKGG